MNPVVRLKQVLAHMMLIVEFCHRCGLLQPVIWHAPDALWEQVSEDWGVLCPKCFDELARRKGVPLLVWVPEPY